MRIRTKPIEDSGIFLPIQLQQSFSEFEVLSLKFTQNEIYNSMNSNYGVIVGRVYSNSGFGIPNAKISVFIPLEDGEDDMVSEIYPYKTINDLDSDGYRYNLLRKYKENNGLPCYVPTGTFPNKKEILDDDIKHYIYGKYYKYTTTTNYAGDYMLTGVPVGSQIVHVDVDYSDISVFSLKPIDYIARGVSASNFENTAKFRKSNNLNELVQINSVNTSLYVKPLYGQDGETGLNRLDIPLNQNLDTSAVLTGSVFTDNLKNKISRNCRPQNRSGRNCQLSTTKGLVEILRYNPVTKKNDYITTNTHIDEDGVYIVPITLNSDAVITDEFGNTIPALIDGTGVYTTAKIRTRFTLNQNTNFKTQSGSVLVPNLYNDFTFDQDTDIRSFKKIKWNNVYTSSQYIPRYQRTTQDSNGSFTGIKKIGDCDTNTNFPFNRLETRFNPLYIILCSFISVIGRILAIIDNIGNPDFNCEGCTNGQCDDAQEWRECMKLQIAQDLNVLDFSFYNNWVNGGLYMPAFRYKIKYKRNGKVFERFCDFECREIEATPSGDEHFRNKCTKTYIVDEKEYNNSGDYFETNEAVKRISPPFGRGLVVEHDNILYYASRSDIGINTDVYTDLDLTVSDLSQNDTKHLLFATDFISLGSIKKHNIFNDKVLFPLLNSTSYEELTNSHCMVELNSCFKADIGDVNEVVKYCEIGTEIITEEEFENGDGCLLNPTNSDLRKHLCGEFSKFNQNYIHTVLFEDEITDNSGNTIDRLIDNCTCNSNANILTRSNPYYFYFGINNGNTAYEKFYNNYFLPCE